VHRIKKVGLPNFITSCDIGTLQAETIEQITLRGSAGEPQGRKSVYVDSPISLVLMIQVPSYSGKAVHTVLL
jgi:hypothetical protein